MSERDAAGRPDAPTDQPGDASADPDADPETARDRMRRGLRAVRREGRKAALIQATVDAVLVLLAVNLLVRVAAPPSIPSEIPFPGSLVAAGAPAAVDLAAAVGVAAALVAAAVEFVVRLRRPLVEQFESVNPEVSEALRTARDALESDHDGRMATRLYADTVDRLRTTSSVGLLDLRRLVATVLLVALLAPASVHVAAVDFQITVGGESDGGSDGGAPSADREYEGLQSADQVLGEPEDVDPGDRSVEATLSTQGSGNESSSPESYDSGGFAGDDVDVESQQAGFSETERLEDAELIREYNLRIRQEDDRSDQT
jgi:hypothetical protein